MEILSIVGGAMVSLLGLASLDTFKKLLYALFGIPKKEEKEKPYSARLSELTTSLVKASKEVDAVPSVLAQVTRDRENAVQKLEVDLENLENRERELKEKIEVLEKTPIPVAEHFAKILESGKKRNARCDFFLFGSGAVVTTVIAIIIQLAISG